MKLIIKFKVLFIFLFLLVGCSKENDEILPIIETDVYVAGTTNNKATLWKNGKATILGENNSNANCVFVNGDDVYVGGYISGYPVIWKNGTQIILPTSEIFLLPSIPLEFYARYGVTSIFVSGNDVYAVGTTTIGGVNNVGKIWKNGIEIPLLIDASFANEVFIDGTDIYVAGKSIDRKATIWKNGNATNLVESSNSNANSVFVSNGDVYVAGYEDNPRRRARIWKNGIVVPFTNPLEEGIVFSIKVSENNVYSSGFKIVDGKNIPMLWKNSIETIIKGKNTTNFEIKSLFVKENDVFLAGVENYITHRSGAVWTNGNPTLLSYGSNSVSNSIFVTRK